MRAWLEYDAAAVVVLVFGIAAIQLLIFNIS
jgi:hypothetical protein